MAISLVHARLLDQLDQAPAAARVEVSGRLVEDEDRGVARQDARQARSLPFAEAEVMRRAVGLLFELDPFQAIERDPAGFGRGLSQVERSESDVLDDRVAEKLVVRILKDQADPPADLGGVANIDLQSVDPHSWSAGTAAVVGDRPPPWPWPTAMLALPGKRPFKCKSSVLLPAPLGPTSATDSPLLYRQLDAAQGLLAVGIAVLQSADPDRRHGLVATCRRH